MRADSDFLFAYHQTLVFLAGAVCLFGSWAGTRHFARARATEGATRYALIEAAARFVRSEGPHVATVSRTAIAG